jgi:hypothetical protein
LQDVLEDAGFLFDEAAVLREVIKERLCIYNNDYYAADLHDFCQRTGTYWLLQILPWNPQTSGSYMMP